jgi:hypothetical protein
MPLDEQDKQWLRDAMKTAIDDKFKTFETTLNTKLDHITTNLGKRVDRLEVAFGQVARVARTSLVSGAKKDHDQMLRSMFDDSALLLISPLQQDQAGKMTRPAPSKTIQEVQDFVKSFGSEVELEVELAKPSGFRVLVSLFSPQTRRRVAAQFVKDCKKRAMDELQLLIQYDKPFALRDLQRSAHKFLGMVKSAAGGAVTDKTVKGGYLLVNDVRLAPEYLVPDPGRWDAFVSLVAERISRWRGKPPTRVPNDGAFYDLFAMEFAAGRGVFELSDIPELGDEQHMFAAY